jgi:hypothetical protein
MRRVIVKKTDKKESPCLICARPSPLSICVACQQKIQGEMIEKKQEQEKKDRSDKGRR